MITNMTPKGRVHKSKSGKSLVFCQTPLGPRGGRYVLIIHFYVESGQKMIQFNIQFKIESKIFIQWIIHSIFSQKYRFNELFIQYSVRNIDSKFYSKNWIKTIQIYVIKPTQWKPAKRERFPKIMPRACRGVPVKKTPLQIPLG